MRMADQKAGLLDGVSNLCGKLLMKMADQKAGLLDGFFQPVWEAVYEDGRPEGWTA